jgi:hypothetical protein
MGPRFDTPLYFDCDGALEVCGPAGFGLDDVLLEITRLTILQNGVAVPVPNLPLIVVAPASMWETEIPNAKGRLGPGAAQGAGAGFVVTRAGGRRNVSWVGDLMLSDGCQIEKDVAAAAS